MYGAFSSNFRFSKKNVLIFSLGCQQLLSWDLELKGLISVTKKNGGGFYQFLYAVFIGENW